jgi:hypothetical protein
MNGMVTCRDLDTEKIAHCRHAHHISTDRSGWRARGLCPRCDRASPRNTRRQIRLWRCHIAVILQRGHFENPKPRTVRSGSYIRMHTHTHETIVSSTDRGTNHLQPWCIREIERWVDGCISTELP